MVPHHGYRLLSRYRARASMVPAGHILASPAYADAGRAAGTSSARGAQASAARYAPGTATPWAQAAAPGAGQA